MSNKVIVAIPDSEFIKNVQISFEANISKDLEVKDVIAIAAATAGIEVGIGNIFTDVNELLTKYINVPEQAVKDTKTSLNTKVDVAEERHTLMSCTCPGCTIVSHIINDKIVEDSIINNISMEGAIEHTKLAHSRGIVTDEEHHKIMTVIPYMFKSSQN